MYQRIIRSKAPLRISFAGGGTDVPPYPEMKGGAVISTAITKYAYVSLCVKSSPGMTINSIDYDVFVSIKSVSDLRYNGKLDLAKAAIRVFKPELLDQYGFDMITSCDSPPGSGLGSSSAVMVAIIGALSKLSGKSITKYDIAELAYRLERVELGIKGGLQDQYASTFGGFNFIEFDGSHVIVNPLRIDPEVLNELHSNLLLFDTGKTRLSAGILERQIKSVIDKKEQALESLDMIKKIAVEMKNYLLKGDLSTFGELLWEEWQYKKRLDPQISNPTLDHLFDIARKEGAIGGKLCGAGGGGHILIYSNLEVRHNVIKALEKAGCKHIAFGFEPYGLQVWEVKEGKVKV
jgi:D-glycero-alpha-D-manno-heptose-7-phosphate kinase